MCHLEFQKSLALIIEHNQLHSGIIRPFPKETLDKCSFKSELVGVVQASTVVLYSLLFAWFACCHFVDQPVFSKVAWESLYLRVTC
uniref:Uncharacterized protein n=1 Tax=Arundo donax TaxID=35708 RepID=A0A0A9AMG0_ARUDO